MSLSGKDNDIARLSMMDRIGDRFLTVTDLYVFAVCFGNSCLDVVDDCLWLLESRVV